MNIKTKIRTGMIAQAAISVERAGPCGGGGRVRACGGGGGGRVRACGVREERMLLL